MEPTREERLAEFFRRLSQAPRAHSREEALEQIRQILNRVEDEMTAIPYHPDHWQSDGRLYSPQDDSIRDVPGHPAVKRFRSRSHNTFIGENGSIEIRSIRPNAVQFSREGVDGRGEWEL